jgi:hypothetical protein
MTRECTEERFLKDVSEHQMTVLRDEGVNRHLRFRKPGTGCMGFDILTWPGYLCFTGDMGTYVFRRLEDMLAFFRTDARYARGDGLAINPGYWGEKLEAIDRHGGFREWSEELFEQAVRQDVETFTDGWEKDQKADLLEAVENDVLNAGDQHDCIQAVRDFSHEGADDLFTDFWERRLEDFTYRFLWCCYALAWTVKQYDAAPVSGVALDARPSKENKRG